MNPPPHSQHPPAQPGQTATPGLDTAPGSLRELLSALADGEVGPDGTRQACAAFREDAEARRTWHSYQLIGDVLRSEELASAPARDAAFLAGLRQRLAQEPVVLAPEPLPPLPQPVVASPSLRRSPRWLAPAAVAAGFMAVAGVLVVTRMTEPQATPQAMLAGGAPATAGAAAAVAPALSAPGVPNFTLATGPAVLPASPSGAAMLRDAQLDLYLNAHQAARRGGAVALPGTALRSVEIVIPAGNQP